MQQNVTFAAGRVGGTLKHVSNWTQFSADTRYNTGNFLCFKLSSTTAGVSFAAGLQPKYDTSRADWVTDTDNEFVFQIHDKAEQKLLVKVSKGDVEYILTYDLNGLTLEDE